MNTKTPTMIIDSLALHADLDRTFGTAKPALKFSVPCPRVAAAIARCMNQDAAPVSRPALPEQDEHLVQIGPVS